MLFDSFNFMITGIIILSFFSADYFLGNGFLDMGYKLLNKMAGFIKKEEELKEEAKIIQGAEEAPINFLVLLFEILVLTLTIAFLNKYKQLRGKDRIDDLLKESKEALRQTNEYLEKWRLRRVPMEYSYLDDEPQQIKPLKLEVPILHMAIIDTLGTARSKPDDAGDTIDVIDSAMLSLTSLVDDDMDSISDQETKFLEEKASDQTKNVEFNNRFLWDVMEEAEDFNNLEG